MSIFTINSYRSFLSFILFSFLLTTHLCAEEIPGSSGKVSFYSENFTGQRTASGEYYKPDEYTCAHTFYPFGTLLKLKKGKRAVIVRVNDRGPFVGNRILDISYIAAKDLGIVSAGVAEVSIELFDPTFYDTSDTILLAKVLSPDDKRFKLAMNMAKVEREAKQREKIAELDAKHAAKKGKKSKKELKTEKEESNIKGKKKSKKEVAEDVAEKNDKKSVKEKQTKTDIEDSDKKSKMKKEKKEAFSEKKNNVTTKINAQVAEAEILAKNADIEQKTPILAAKNINEKKIDSIQEKKCIVIENNLEETKKVSNFASDINDTQQKKSSKWWIFPWLIAIVGLIFGVVFMKK